MNPLLRDLRPYPFERLAKLLDGCEPEGNLEPILMTMGEPTHPAPPIVERAMIRALPLMGKYPPTKGPSFLREAIADWIRRRHGLALDPERNILPALGTREALFCVAQVVLGGEAGKGAQGGASDSDGSPGSIGQAGLSAAEPSAGLGADARPLEEGVTILARPPGKKNSTIHQLSGGEKALAAMSLVFALFTLNPAPFCLLDEVDAPLDDVNTLRFCKLVEALSERTQFLYISHNQITMRMANQLLGVTQREKGVSRIVAVNLDEAVKMAG